MVEMTSQAPAVWQGGVSGGPLLFADQGGNPQIFHAAANERLFERAAIGKASG